MCAISFRISLCLILLICIRMSDVTGTKLVPGSQHPHRIYSIHSELYVFFRFIMFITSPMYLDIAIYTV
jgi:hypothetical protein